MLSSFVAVPQLFEDVIGFAAAAIPAAIVRDPFSIVMAVQSGTTLVKGLTNKDKDEVTGLPKGTPSNTPLETIRMLSEDVTQEDFTTIWKDWKSAYNASSDQAKLVMSQKKLDEYMEPYLTLEAGEVYKYTMAA